MAETTPAAEVPAATVSETQTQTTTETEKATVNVKEQNGHSKTEESKTEESKTEESKTEESKTEESKTEESKTEESKTEESKTEESKTEESKTEESKTKESKTDDAELHKKIMKQIEYYFGDFNLPRDKFLFAEIKKDDGWVPLTIMLKFARLAKMTTDAEVIVAAIKGCENTIMQVDYEKTKIRRSADAPLPELSEGLQEESIKRTVYCKGFLKDGSVTLDDLLEFFKQFGDSDSIRMRNYSDKVTNVQGFKGSVLVVFKTVELAKDFLEKPTMQYQKVYLIRKWFGDYLEEKKKEVEERRAKKLAKLEKTANEVEEKNKSFQEIPKGSFLRASGFSETTTREDIKAAVFDLTNDCAFVNFQKGDKEAYIRFSEAGSNKKILQALKDTLTVNEAKISVFMVEGEEEEAQLEKANEARRRSMTAGHGNNFKKRKGGYGGRGGGRNKRQRV